MPTPKRLALAALFLLGLTGVSWADTYSIRLPNRIFVPIAGIDPDLGDKLDTPARGSVYGLVQLVDPVTPQTHAKLSAAGITLHEYVGGRAFVANFSPATSSAVVQALLRSPVQWAGDYQPEDKLEPAVANRDFASWAVRPGGRVTLVVRFHRGVSAQEANSAFNLPHHPDFRRIGLGSDWVVNLDPRDIDPLASHELVLRIAQGPHPMLPAAPY